MPWHPVNWRRALLLLSVVLANFGIDRVTKLIAQANLLGRGTVEVVGQVFILHYAENAGAFLSMGSRLGDSARFVVLALVPAIMLLGGTVYLYRRVDLSRAWFYTWGCILGGGFANVWDRLLNDGRVIDFMNFGIGNLRTGILNVADLSITFGVIVLLFTEGKGVTMAGIQGKR